MQYIFKDGKTMDVPEALRDLTNDIPEEVMKSCVKVNLPEDEAQERRGNGEGIFAVGDAAFMEDHNTNRAGVIHLVKILNHSYQGPHLAWGSIVPVMLRGLSRPMAILSEISREDYVFPGHPSLWNPEWNKAAAVE